MAQQTRMVRERMALQVQIPSLAQTAPPPNRPLQRRVTLRATLRLPMHGCPGLPILQTLLQLTMQMERIQSLKALRPLPTRLQPKALLLQHQALMEPLEAPR